MNIAIVGCGIGGLAAANLLAQDGHTVRIFERFEQPKPVGSGLVIQPVGQQVLEQIGVLSAVSVLGASIERMYGEEVTTGRIALDVTYAQKGARRSGLAIHRASLFNGLLDATKAAGIPIETGQEINSVSPNGCLTHCSGKASDPFDLVIDAAGATSPLRASPTKTLKYGALWGNVDWPGSLDLPRNMLHQRYKGASNMLGILPIGWVPGDNNFKAAIFWSLPVAAYDDWCATPLANWKAEALSIWPEFGTCLDQITSRDQLVMARYTHGTLKKLWHDKLVHIGDAAHTASPQLGQGANMALLDAAALTTSLRENGPLEWRLASYARRRRWHVALYQTMSSIFTPLYQSDSTLLPALRDRVLAPFSRLPPVPRILSKLVCGDLIKPES